MGRADYYKEGDYNAVCSMCGRKRKASELVRNWQGMYRCPSHNEPRHPQDFVRATPEEQTPSWTQPPPVDIFILFCTPNSRTAISNFAVADCAICDFIDLAFDSTGD